jgi:transposase-like protein
MLIHLHKQATTTPKVRAAIQQSDEVGTLLAERFGVTPQTIYKWRNRDSVEDRSHTPHRLQTTLTPAQEAVAVELRRTLLVSLDDLLAVVREFLNPNVSRSGLDRCLRRHGVGNLHDLQAKDPRPKHKAFKAYEPGYLHVDVKYLPQMAEETSRRYLFVAIDRATRWVFIRIFKAKTAANARRFLRDLERACPIRIRTILTDNVLRAELEVESSHDISVCKIAPAALSSSIGIRNTLQSRRLPRVMEKVSSIANTGSRNVLALTVLNTSF